MLDLSHLPKGANYQFFPPVCTLGAGAGTAWTSWRKPRGKGSFWLLAVGGGGAGGTGAVGAASTAGGGGGGGSGAAVCAFGSLLALPDVLYISPGPGGVTGNTSGAISYVCLAPNTTGQNVAFRAAPGTGGGAGGAGSGGSAGGAGGAGTYGSIAALCNVKDTSGQAGIIGGAAIAGGALTIPTQNSALSSGFVTMGGTGGGGLGAANVAGKDGGAITGAGIWPGVVGGTGGTTAPTAGNPGVHGTRAQGKLLAFYGGTGGGSCGLSVTPTGANGGAGGNGAYGCGGGGGGAAFTGNTGGAGGKGGDGFVIIVCW